MYRVCAVTVHVRIEAPSDNRGCLEAEQAAVGEWLGSLAPERQRVGSWLMSRGSCCVASYIVIVDARLV